MGYQLGIDLGTTFTAAAVHRDGRVEIASLGDRAAAIPSVVFLRPDEGVLVGEPASRRAITEPERVAREFKRRVGDPVPVILGGAAYPAEALMARLLSWVVGRVTEREGGPPEAIAVSHPANWGPYKTDLLDQAVRMADLGGVVRLTEPEAAAIYYASTERVEVGDVVAVYDLGGGTFDAAVLRKTADGFAIVGSPEGIERLGGIDFDQAVFAHAARTLGGALDELDPEDRSVIAAVARLRQDCVEAKEALSSDTDAAIPVFLPTVRTEVRITRSELEGMIRPAIAETIAALRRALRSAAVEPADVSAVLLVGGSSRIPLVGQMVSAELGRPVAVDAHPKHAVALGAAIAAAASRPGATEAEPPEVVAGEEEIPPAAAAAPEVAPAPGEVRPPPSPGPPRSRLPLLIGAGVLTLAVVAVAMLTLGGDGEPPAVEPSATGGPSPTVTSGTPPVGPAALSWERVDDAGGSLGGPGDQAMWRAAAGGPGLVGVGSDSSGGDLDAAVWLSADGREWERVPHDEGLFGGPGNQHMNTIVAGGPGFVAVGWDASGGDLDAAVWTSVDGVTWERAGGPDAGFSGPGEQFINKVTVGGPGLVAVGADGRAGTSDAAVWLSSDGAAWERVTGEALRGPGTQRLRGIAIGAGTMVAVGFDSGSEGADAAAWFSADGRAWQRVPQASLARPGDDQMAMAVPGGPGFLAAGFAGSDGGDSQAAVWTSADGASWSLDPSGVFGGPGDQDIEFLVETTGGWVAVGSGGRGQEVDVLVWTSEDGTSWKPSGSPRLGGPGVQSTKGLTLFGSAVVVTGWEIRGGESDAVVWIGTPED